MIATFGGFAAERERASTVFVLRTITRTHLLCCRYSRDPADLANAYVHLGNQCLNITNPEFHQEEGVDGQGPRWSLGAWRARMEREGHNTELIQRKIDNLIAKVVIACQPRILEFMRDRGVIESQCYEVCAPLFSPSIPSCETP